MIIQTIGATAIVRKDRWTAQAGLTTHRGTQLVVIKLRTLNFEDKQPEGTIAKNTRRCITTDIEFSKSLGVEQHQRVIVDGNNEAVAYDCYIFAEATITAGAYTAKDCQLGQSKYTQAGLIQNAAR